MSDVEAGVRAWVEDVAGGSIVSLDQIPAGGRTGYRVDVETADGSVRELFLQRGGRGGLGSFMGFDREAEVYRALEPLGIPIPHVWGVDEARDVLLVDRAPGLTWFQPPRDPAVALAVAQDFMQHLAAWHKAGAAALDLPSFGPVKTVREHQEDQLAAIKESFDAQDAREPIDLLASTQLEHLLGHVPDVADAPVLVQGDTGPGNLMYEGDRVTAIIDWELAHIGDPMDDIAWLSWRATQHGWPDFPARLREYEAASGITVDPARVHYYRLNACARLGASFGLADMGQAAQRRRDAALTRTADAAVDRTADGSGFIMNMLHRRMRLTAQADAMGIDLPGREVGAEAEPGVHASLYDVVLDQLKGIVDRVDDRVPSSMAKNAARLVKYLKEIDRNGAQFDEHERDDIGRLLGAIPSSLDEGRVALAAAARDGKVDLDDYLLYHWNRLVRDDWLMRPSSGAMYERGWPALT
jgi:aminoglycoside phosphotransferase (APT) family kinase protein